MRHLIIAAALLFALAGRADAGGNVTTLAVPQITDVAVASAANATSITASWHSTPAAGELEVCASIIGNLVWMKPSSTVPTGWNRYGGAPSGGQWTQIFAPQSFAYHMQGQPFGTVYWRIAGTGGTTNDAIPSFASSLNSGSTVTPNGSMALDCFRFTNVSASHPIDNVLIAPVSSFSGSVPAATNVPTTLGERRLTIFGLNSEISGATALSSSYNTYGGFSSTSNAAASGYDTASVAHTFPLAPTAAASATAAGGLTPTITSQHPSGANPRAVQIDIVVNRSDATDGGFTEVLPEQSDAIATARCGTHVEFGQSQYNASTAWESNLAGLGNGVKNCTISGISYSDVNGATTAYTQAKAMGATYHMPVFLSLGACVTAALMQSALNQMGGDGITIPGVMWWNEAQNGTASCSAVNTHLTTSGGNASPATFTPASMDSIFAGDVIKIDSENVTVISVGTSTFTANSTVSHAANAPVVGVSHNWAGYYADSVYGFQAMKNVLDSTATAHPSWFTAQPLMRGPSDGSSFDYYCQQSQPRGSNCKQFGIGGLGTLTGGPSVAAPDAHIYTGGKAPMVVWAGATAQCPQTGAYGSYACFMGAYNDGTGNLPIFQGERGLNTYSAGGYTPITVVQEYVQQDTFALAIQGFQGMPYFNAIDGTGCAGGPNLGPLPNMGATLNAAITSTQLNQTLTVAITERSGSGHLNVGDSVHVTDSGSQAEVVTALSGSSDTQLVANFTKTHAAGDGVGEGSASGQFAGNGMLNTYSGSTCPPYSGTSYAPKPSFAALQSQIGALADPGAAFTPTPVGFTLSGTTANDYTFVTQKRNGETTLWLMNTTDEVQSYGSTYSRTIVQTMSGTHNVTVHFPAGMYLGTVYTLTQDENGGDPTPLQCPIQPAGSGAGTPSPGDGCMVKTILTVNGSNSVTIPVTNATPIGVRWGM